jgi:hypothetical protein
MPVDEATFNWSDEEDSPDNTMQPYIALHKPIFWPPAAVCWWPWRRAVRDPYFCVILTTNILTALVFTSLMTWTLSTDYALVQPVECTLIGQGDIASVAHSPIQTVKDNFSLCPLVVPKPSADGTNATYGGNGLGVLNVTLVTCNYTRITTLHEATFEVVGIYGKCSYAPYRISLGTTSNRTTAEYIQRALPQHVQLYRDYTGGRTHGPTRGQIDQFPTDTLLLFFTLLAYWSVVPIAMIPSIMILDTALRSKSQVYDSIRAGLKRFARRRRHGDGAV